MVALERAGIEVESYFASEIDPYAIQVSKKNYPQIVQLGDVTNWRDWDIPWSNIDLLMGGSPCQSLSITMSRGRDGLNGKSKLFFEFVDILTYLRSKNPDILFLFENVASMPADSKAVMEDMLGTKLVYQNSNAFSAQDRPRVYATNFPFEAVDVPSNTVLKDILEPEVDQKYYYDCAFDYLGEKNIAAKLHLKGHDYIKRVHSPNYKSHTLTACEGGNHQQKVLINGKPRKLTPREYERLQTLPDDYTAGLSDTRRYTCIGNAWTVDVIVHILNTIKRQK